MSIVWTVLPNGFQGAVFRASVLVSPRIAGASFAGTPFTNWPTALGGFVFRLYFDPIGTSFPVTPAAQFDASLWTTIFGSATVKPFAFKDNSTRPIWSYPVARAKAFIDDVYAYVQSTSPTSPPPVDLTVSNPLTDAIVQTDRANNQRVDQVRQIYATPRAMPSPASWTAAAQQEQSSLGGLSANARALYLAKRFYARPASTSSKDDKGNRVIRPRPTAPTFDFHEKLSILADHPYLMRRLGLVLDFQFQSDIAVLGTNGFVRLGVFDQLGNPVADCVTPRTAYEIVGSSYFRAASRAVDADVRDGFVPLDDANTFFVSQGETDGDTQKFVGFASNVAMLTSKLSVEAGQATAAPPQTLPARRTTGFFVARNGRGDALAQRFTSNASLNTSLTSAAPNDLYAIDLLRGYRFDVKTSSSGWYSLHRRRVSYSYGVMSPTPIVSDLADEAFVKAHSATSDSDPSGPPDMYVHEVMFGWEGWSLAAPRPGRRLMPVYATPGDSIKPPDNPPSSDFPLNAPVRAEPGSLIPLRFGYPYSFRARAVDLAGNSLAVTDPGMPGAPHASALQTYKRYEPIPPPTLVLRYAVTEGESVENLVIRSGEGMGTDAYAQFLNATYADPKFAAKVYRAASERHVAPPKTSQAMAEAHGDFDGAFAINSDKKAFFRLATREEGTFADKRIPSLTVDDGYIDGNPNQAAIVTPPQVPMDQRRAADGGSMVSSLTENRGDPLAPGEYVVCGVTDATLPYLPDSTAGGAVFFDPAAGGATLLSATWQGTWPDVQTFRLQLTDGPAVMGGTVAGRLGTITLPPATILTLEYASIPANNRLSHMAYVLDYGVPMSELASGRHWMITPRRTITLVHAVPKPLAAPVANVQITRGNDQTFVTHTGVLTSHSRSTNHVDMEATWQETIDVPTKPLPDDGVSSPTIAQSGHAYQVPVAYGSDTTQILRLHHELHDTKHRNVTYTPVAQTRYKEYFPAALVADASKITLAGSAPGPRSDKSFSIPSSSRPIVPKIVYVVPTFKWEAASGKSVRRGGGLRVYLERPWYATGEGELLAVLLSASASPIDQVSRWGRDPIFSDGVAAALAAKDFKNAKATATGVALADGSGTVDLAAFGVEFNADRRLWFCDVEIDPGSAYFPFVSLALARYQPQSLSGLEISPMVRADFAQLAADRTLEFNFDAQSVSVAVSGPVSANAAESLLPPIKMPPSVTTVGQMPVPTTHRIVAYVQERAPGSVGEMGWATISSETSFDGSMAFNSNLARWIAKVGLPPASSTPKERRVVVEEREYFAADSGDTPQLRGGSMGDGVGYRVVYLDTVPVPA